VKQFWLFGGESYYATGGMNDFIADFESLYDAIVDAEKRESSIQTYDTIKTRDYVEWWHVVDVTSGKIVKESECDPYGAS
jgi:hypothetical protein